MWKLQIKIVARFIASSTIGCNGSASKLRKPSWWKVYLWIFWVLICLFNCWATSYLVIAVYRPPGLNIKSFIDHFTILFEKKRLHIDKIVLLGDFNISLNVNYGASKIWNSFFEDFGLTQYVSEKRHRSGGIPDHVIASNNYSINVKSNSFITSSDHSFVSFSLSSVKQRKSQHCLMYRNWKKYDFEGFLSYWSRA